MFSFSFKKVDSYADNCHMLILNWPDNFLYQVSLRILAFEAITQQRDFVQITDDLWYTTLTFILELNLVNVLQNIIQPHQLIS